MSLESLLNTPCQIITRSDEGDQDAYGDPILTETVTETVCALQQNRRDEPGDMGELSDTLWTLFLPTDTELATDDAVVAYGKVFELVGDPWDAREGSADMWHVEATVRRTAGGEEGS